MSQDEVLTLDEAAQHLKLARKMVRDWVRVWRVKASAVEQHIAAVEARQSRPVLVPNEDEG